MRTPLLHPLALVALAAFSCKAGGNPTLIIREICFPPEPSNGTCSYDPQCDQGLAGTPVLDVSADNTDPSLVLPVQIDNAVPSSADEDTGNLDTAYVQIKEYRFEFNLEGLSLPSASTQSHQTINSSSSTVALVPIIPPAVGQTLRGRIPVSAVGSPIYKRVTVTFTAKGTTGDGEDVESGEFVVPVDVCDGCLTGNPCPLDKPNWVGACPKAFQTSINECVGT